MADRPEDILGLGSQPVGQWPSTFGDGTEAVIEKLRPGSKEHDLVKQYLLVRLQASERKMSQFYARWNASELKVQAYITLPQWEQVLDSINQTGAPPQIVSLNVPYAFATISTIVTFLITAFASKKPMFQVVPAKAGAVEPAKHMEAVHDYNAEHTRMVSQLFQFFRDGETYGVGILRLAWRSVTKPRSVRRKVLDAEGKEIWETRREDRLVYEGNEVEAWDPFLFFPDHRVPMTKVNKKGEYVFWRSFEGKHSLLQEEAAGDLKWVQYAGALPAPNATEGESARAERAGGEGTPGNVRSGADRMGANFIQRDQCTIDIIPKELGLGPRETVQRWVFSILNKNQIVQAAPVEDDHEMHPVAVAEPYSLGYGFGNLGMGDFLGPLQDTISWFINSHFDNVRRTLNDMMVVDPQMVEMQDLERPGPGKIIRLKKAAFGRDVRSAIQQLPINDVTQGHVKDAELMMLVGQRISAVTDNLTGVGEQGGRRTATEIRSNTGSALSRLQAQAKLYSAQALVDLNEMQTLNVQQYMQEEFFTQIAGQNGKPEGLVISPEMLVGDFNFPVHDGTLPIDKIALLDIWRQIFIQVQGDPVLRKTYAIQQIFEYIAELGGIVNLASFRVDARPDEEIEQEVQKGNMIAAALGSGSNGRGSIPGLGNLPSVLGGNDSSRSPTGPLV